MELHGVTSIMQRLALVNYSAPWFTDEARERGKVLHACCALVDEDKLNWGDVPLDMYEEVVAYYAWKQRNQFKATATEKILHSSAYYYAGTPDVYGYLDDLPAVIDRKRGVANKATRWQLSGYAQLVAEETGIPAKSIRRLALHKLTTHTAHIIEYDNNEGDLRGWLYLVAVHNKLWTEGIFK